MKFILNYIRKDIWLPYVAGILLGMVGILAVWLSNSLLGASGSFEKLERGYTTLNEQFKQFNLETVSFSALFFYIANAIIL